MSIEYLFLSFNYQHESIPDDTWRGDHGKLYKVFNVSYTMENANAFCQDNDAFLPEPKNLAESNYLAELTNRNYFLGMRLDVGVIGVTRGHWLSDNSPVVWTNWHPNHETNEEGHMCAVMRGQVDKWRTRSCEHKRDYVVCEKCEYFIVN